MKSRNLMQSVCYALEGLCYALRTQRNMRIHMLVAIAVLFAAYGLKFSPPELAILLLTIFLVMGSELLNTALEATVDLCTPEYNHLARRAKNVAAGAVLAAAIIAVIVGCLLFAPHLLSLWTSVVKCH